VSCENCGNEAPYVLAITPGGLTKSCPKCHFVPKPEAPASEPPKAPPPIAAVEPESVVVLQPSSDVIQAVRLRLATVEAELCRMAGLQAERRTLAAMVRAAERQRR
jgi:hypothetical protein